MHPTRSAYTLGHEAGTAAGQRRARPAFFWRGFIAGLFVGSSLVAVFIHEGIL